MKVYFISGLGADARAFSKLSLPQHIDPVFLEWIKPEEGESLASYSRRLAEPIDQREPFILVGLSMGGMVAVEIARILKSHRTIIISSVHTHESFPKRLKLAGKLRLFRIIPVSWLKSGSMIKRIFFGEAPHARKLIRDMIRDSDPHFIKWALKAIGKWQNTWRPPALIHIHGENDEIFPLRYCKPDFIIPKGAHLMIVTQSDEVSGLLAELL